MRHHCHYLNDKTGFLVGRDVGSFYGAKVWLEKEQFTVVVNQTNVVPANATVKSFSDVLVIFWKIFIHNLAVKLDNILRR